VFEARKIAVNDLERRAFAVSKRDSEPRRALAAGAPPCAPQRTNPPAATAAALNNDVAMPRTSDIQAFETSSLSIGTFAQPIDLQRRRADAREAQRGAVPHAHGGRINPRRLESLRKRIENRFTLRLRRRNRQSSERSDREELPMEKRDIVELTEAEIAAVAGGGRGTDAQTGIRGIDE
jgi:hypothetical protein